MLTNITIKNFKCFPALSLPLAPLTMLTGFNASGKSTTLQSMLLMAQALRAGGRKTEIPLSGPLVTLGSPGEIIRNGAKEVAFTFKNLLTSAEWVASAKERDQGLALQLDSVVISSNDNNIPEWYPASDVNDRFLPANACESAKEIVNALSNIIYLSAIRDGTGDVYPSPMDSSSVYANVGTKGEFAPWWYYYNSDNVPESRRHPTDNSKIFINQFNAWMNEIFPGAEADVLPIAQTSLVRFALHFGNAPLRRPSNIGYGLTYAFPIIVAGLLAQKGQILIIDSPEAHIHPKGQSQIGGFLAHVASSGVQVIIETHSDHILNGIRVAIKQRTISSEKFKAYFFSQTDKKDSVANEIEVLPDGRIEDWPLGFFDQMVIDLEKL